MNNFLNEFYKMPFIFHDKNKIFDDLKEKYSENNRLYNDFLMDTIFL